MSGTPPSVAELSRLRMLLAERDVELEQTRAALAILRRETADVLAELDAVRAEAQLLRRASNRPHQAGPPVAAPPSARPWPPLAESEAAVQATFSTQLAEPLDSVPNRGAPPDDGGLTADVVVCVHDAPEDVRACLRSLDSTPTRPFRLIIVDDGSGAPTRHLLDAYAAAHPEVTLLRSDDPPHGYTIAANLGLRASTADYVVLLNSDTVVTPGWLERIVERGEQDPSLGILGPLSNAASHQSVPELRDDAGWATNPLPGWLTPDGMALAVRGLGRVPDVRLPFINGFCYVIKRAVIDAVGLLDEERFASGYCEENDYSLRAGDAGFSLGVVEDAYVFHAKSRSFGVEGRRAIARRNYELFRDKHGAKRVDGLVAELEADERLAPVRDAVGRSLASPHAFVRALSNDGRSLLEVAFVLPGLGDGGSGGSHSIYQEARGMRELGIPARILLPERAMGRARAAYADADSIFEPFADEADLVRRTRSADVISATHNKSVRMVAAVREARKDFLPVYYVQDYEPFFTQAESADVQEAVDSYTAVDGMQLFAKTGWLCDVVAARHGLRVAKVEPSLDTDVYRPTATRRNEGPLRVVAMVRPRTPRRQPFSTLQVLDRIREDHGDAVEVVTFGCRPEELAKLHPSDAIVAGHRGLLRREAVAELLGDSDVFLDMSTYQAFGRTALEAMACGATAVVPEVGGVWEFVRQDENAIAVDTLDRQAAYDALAGLVGDRDRVDRLRVEALATAAAYSVVKAAVSEYVLFEHEYRRRFG